MRNLLENCPRCVYLQLVLEKLQWLDGLQIVAVVSNAREVTSVHQLSGSEGRVFLDDQTDSWRKQTLTNDILQWSDSYQYYSLNILAVSDLAGQACFEGSFSVLLLFLFIFLISSAVHCYVLYGAAWPRLNRSSRDAGTEKGAKRTLTQQTGE